MPAALLGIIRLIASFAGAGLGSAGASRFAVPAIGKAVARFAPGLAQRSLPFFKSKTVGGLGAGTANILGTGLGFGATDALFGELAPDRADEVDSNEVQLANMLNALPVEPQRENRLGLEKMFNEHEIRQVLEMMGVDFDDFASMASPQGLI